MARSGDGELVAECIEPCNQRLPESDASGWQWWVGLLLLSVWIPSHRSQVTLGLPPLHPTTCSYKAFSNWCDGNLFGLGDAGETCCEERGQVGRMSCIFPQDTSDGQGWSAAAVVRYIQHSLNVLSTGHQLQFTP